MILIIAIRDDAHTDAVIVELENKKADYIVLDTYDLWETVDIYELIGGADNPHYLYIAGGKIDVRDIHTVWHRRTRQPISPSSSAIDGRIDTVHQKRTYLEALYLQLVDAFWVNPLYAAIGASSKPYQLEVARRIGLNIPRTLITNQATTAIKFAQETDSDIAYKTLSGYGKTTDANEDLGIYTNRITLSSIVERADSISLCPCLFQKYIDKEIEVRVTVMGSKLFALAIYSQRSSSTVVDYRRDLLVPLYEPHELPEHMKQKIMLFMKMLGLVFGCLDFIVSSDGRYIFLEINPYGQWLWVERVSKMSLVPEFVSLLMDK